MRMAGVQRKHAGWSPGTACCLPMFRSRVPTTSCGPSSPNAGSLHDGSSCRLASVAAGDPPSVAHAATKQMTWTLCVTNS